MSGRYVLTIERDKHGWWLAVLQNLGITGAETGHMHTQTIEECMKAIARLVRSMERKS